MIMTKKEIKSYVKNVLEYKPDKEYFRKLSKNYGWEFGGFCDGLLLFQKKANNYGGYYAINLMVDNDSKNMEYMLAHNLSISEEIVDEITKTYDKELRKKYS